MLTMEQVRKKIAQREQELSDFTRDANASIAALRGAITQLKELEQMLLDAENADKADADKEK